MNVWVDCTAAAHPLVLRPIVERLSEAGHDVSITARDYGQTLGLLDRLGMPYEAFGSHGGAATVGKAAALARRSPALARWARRRRFDLAIAHGSVDLAVVSASASDPVRPDAGLRARRAAASGSRSGSQGAFWCPRRFRPRRCAEPGAAPRKLVRYPGLKEDYYLADFQPDPAVLEELGVDRERVLVVVRPPPETSAYHERNPLYDRVLDRLAAEPAATAVVIPRTQEQGLAVRARGEPSVIVPEGAIDAQSLIAYADLVVSAGGTMNREAVALGTPVYTIFSGAMGAVDHHLIAQGRLRILDDPSRINLRKRDEPTGVLNPRDPAVLVDGVLGALK